MLRIFVITLSTLLMSPALQAACTLARGQLTTLSIPAKVMTISADAPIDTSKPFAQFDTPTLGTPIGYDDCPEGQEYGKRAINLTGQDGTTKIFQTNVKGIGIKLQANNGVAFGGFPTTSILRFDNGETVGTFDLAATYFYRVEFFKTGELVLTNPQNGDIVLPPNTVGYTYLGIPDIAHYTVKLDIGEMKIISTPACTLDTPNRTIDFNRVTPALLKAGVTRNLDFAITCKSDYGAYAAKAAMVTTTPSADSSYIKVEDAGGNMDRLGIRITDSTNRLVKVDGSTTEAKNSITSQRAAEFTWKATLIAGSNPTPAGGVFTAKAEIIFDIE